MSTILDMQSRTGVGETERLSDGVPGEASVDVRCVEHVPASRRILDRDGEGRDLFDAVRRDPGGPMVSPVDHDLTGAHRTDPTGGLESGTVSSERRHFDLIPEERVHER